MSVHKVINGYEIKPGAILGPEKPFCKTTENEYIQLDKEKEPQDVLVPFVVKQFVRHQGEIDCKGRCIIGGCNEIIEKPYRKQFYQCVYSKISLIKGSE
jgi:hypothetical protein